MSTEMIARQVTPVNRTASNSACLVPQALWDTVCARSQTLFEDGRRIEPIQPGQFRILAPEQPGYVPKILTLHSLAPLRYHCTCKCYARWQGCKHGEGAAPLIRAQVADYSARMNALAALKLDVDALDAAQWDLMACWAHTRNSECDAWLNVNLSHYVAERGSK